MTPSTPTLSELEARFANLRPQADIIRSTPAACTSPAAQEFLRSLFAMVTPSRVSPP